MHMQVLLFGMDKERCCLCPETLIFLRVTGWLNKQKFSVCRHTLSSA